MPQRIPLQGIVVHREVTKNGVTTKVPVTPKIGVPFDFTSDEINQLMRIAPNAIRTLINENELDSAITRGTANAALSQIATPALPQSYTGKDTPPAAPSGENDL